MLPSIYRDNMGFLRGLVLKTDAEEEDQYGRLKIKVWGIYPDDTEPDDLPWAWPETPGIIGGKYQEGWSSVPEPGSVVKVYFDFGDINTPIYCGTVPGLQHKVNGDNFESTKPVFGIKNDKKYLDKQDGHEQDFHRLGLSKPSFDYNQKLDENWEPDEDSPEYKEGEDKWRLSWAKQHENVKYPYNHVFSTGRMTVEYDNTDGYERLTLGHWIGSYISLDWEGDIISKAHNNHWLMTNKNKISWAKENEVNLAKNSVHLVEEKMIQAIGGDSAIYYGKKSDQDYNYEGSNILSEVSTPEEGSSNKHYVEWMQNLEYKLNKNWYMDVVEDLKQKIGGDLHQCITGDKIITVTGTLDASSKGVMNFNAPIIKLNCGGAASASCPDVTDPLASPSPTTPDRKEQADTNQIEETNEAFLALINKDVGAKCSLL